MEDLVFVLTFSISNYGATINFNITVCMFIGKCLFFLAAFKVRCLILLLTLVNSSITTVEFLRFKTNQIITGIFVQDLKSLRPL